MSLLRVAAVLLVLLSVALLVAAFTRFEAVDLPRPGTEAFQDYQDQRMRETRLSMGLGILAAFSLLGAATCYTHWQQRKAKGS